MLWCFGLQHHAARLCKSIYYCPLSFNTISLCTGNRDYLFSWCWLLLAKLDFATFLFKVVPGAQVFNFSIVQLFIQYHLYIKKLCKVLSQKVWPNIQVTVQVKRCTVQQVIHSDCSCKWPNSDPWNLLCKIWTLKDPLQVEVTG